MFVCAWACVWGSFALASSTVTMYWNSRMYKGKADLTICIFSHMWIPSAQDFWVCCQFVLSYKVSCWVNVQFLCRFGRPKIVCCHSLVTVGIESLRRISWEVRLKVCYAVEWMWLAIKMWQWLVTVQRPWKIGIVIWWILLKAPVLEQILNAFSKPIN